MLTDPKEIEIISRAVQVNVRDPKRSRAHFENIFADFLGSVEFAGRSHLDIGAGQYDFGELVRQRSGKCAGLDNDPAVLELGRYKKFETVNIDIENLKDYQPAEPFDGVFNKFSFNAFWFPHEEDHAAFVAKLAALVRPGGWAWLAPWNGLTEDLNIKPEEAAGILATQSQLFRNFGFAEQHLTDAETKRYGVHGRVENNVLFTKNLGPQLAQTRSIGGRVMSRLGLAD